MLHGHQSLILELHTVRGKLVSNLTHLWKPKVKSTVELFSGCGSLFAEFGRYPQGRTGTLNHSTSQLTGDISLNLFIYFFFFIFDSVSRSLACLWWYP